jgi:hypothetical protein
MPKPLASAVAACIPSLFLATLLGGCAAGGATEWASWIRQQAPPQASGAAPAAEQAAPPGPASGFQAHGKDVGVVESSPMILGRDGALSAVAGGRSVWIFGDTIFVDTPSGATHYVSNSWSWTQDFDASHGVVLHQPTTPDGWPASFMDLSPDERAYNVAHDALACTTSEKCGTRWAIWPQVMVADPERKRTLVFYGKVYAEPEGGLHFSCVGHSIGVWGDSGAGPQRPADGAVDTVPEMLFRQDEPGFGSAAVTEANLLYVYACDSNGYLKECRIGRVPLDDALDRSAWQFYTGRRWSDDVTAATSVLAGNDVMTIAYNAYLGKYLAVYAPPFVNQVMLRSSLRPEGPWSDEVLAIDLNDHPPTDLWVYDAAAHPEFEARGGETQYVTYSLFLGNPGAGDYRSETRLVEVTLNRSDGSASAGGSGARP